MAAARDFTKQLRLGIVGLPNIGKSTLFNALTGSSVPASNFPFTTIDPSTSRVVVPDSRFERLVKHFKPKKVTPAWVTVTDIAGLVKGAAEGKGLGNAFLSNIRAVHGIFHLVRGFDAEHITHVEGSVHPIRDARIIDGELQLKDLEMLEKQEQSLAKLARRSNDREAAAQLGVAEKAQKLILGGGDVRDGQWSKAELEILGPWQLLTAKPVSFLVNVTEEQYLAGVDEISAVKEVREHLKEKNREDIAVLPFCGEIEELLMAMEAEEAEEYCKDNGFQSALPAIAQAGYNTLDLRHYFTCGPEEVRAWTIQRGCQAAEAAGLIHSDFQQFFVGADVTACEDFFASGGTSAPKQKGRTYVVEDGDIMLFKTAKGRK